jgi:hypothetical protein
MADPDAGPNQPATTPETLPDGELVRATILLPQTMARQQQAIDEYNPASPLFASKRKLTFVA